jgi:Methyltransferase domain
MKDRFSSQARQYAAFRPTYPAALYAFIFSRVKHYDMAWDAGTGNGQVAHALAGRFQHVMATDISAQQLKNAFADSAISYSVAAEETSFPPRSIDLITVAQAIHWFDRDKFYFEVRRVAKPEAVLAVWGYGLLNIVPEIDLPLRNFYTDLIGPYWDMERRLIDDQYRSIMFPFHEIETPGFQFSFRWTLEELEGYLSTWSSVQHYIKDKGVNPVGAFIEELRPLWKEKLQTVNFPLFLRMGTVDE